MRPASASACRGASPASAPRRAQPKPLAQPLPLPALACSSTCSEPPWQARSPDALVHQPYAFMGLGERRQAGVFVIIADTNVQLAIAFDIDGIGNDCKLLCIHSDVAISGDLERLLGQIDDAVQDHRSAADDQEFLVGHE